MVECVWSSVFHFLWWRRCQSVGSWRIQKHFFLTIVAILQTSAAFKKYLVTQAWRRLFSCHPQVKIMRVKQFQNLIFSWPFRRSFVHKNNTRAEKKTRGTQLSIYLSFHISCPARENFDSSWRISTVEEGFERVCSTHVSTLKQNYNVIHSLLARLVIRHFFPPSETKNCEWASYDILTQE